MTAEEKRLQLKKLLKSDEILVIPGAFNAITAKLVEAKGFKAAYVSGSATSGLLGLADIGVASLEQFTYQAGQVANAVSIPVIADADTGFDDIAKTVRAYEEAGLCGLHLEDQVFPKRCGHLDGKELIPAQEMVEKIKCAVNARQDKNFLIIARCDARSVTNFEDMLRRSTAYLTAGADLIFPEALESLDEFKQASKAFPVLANMTEFGKTPYTGWKEFETAGCQAVIYPVTLFRCALGVMDKALDTIQKKGHQGSLLDEMMHRKDFYGLIDYEKQCSLFNVHFLESEEKKEQ